MISDKFIVQQYNNNVLCIFSGNRNIIHKIVTAVSGIIHIHGLQSRCYCFGTLEFEILSLVAQNKTHTHTGGRLERDHRCCCRTFFFLSFCFSSPLQKCQVIDSLSLSLSLAKFLKHFPKLDELLHFSTRETNSSCFIVLYVRQSFILGCVRYQ